MHPPTQTRSSVKRQTDNTPLMRLLPLAAVALTLIALLALAACGGGNDDTPTPAPAPAATQAPADSGTPEPTTGAAPPAQASPASGTENLFILSRKFESFELNLVAGDIVSVTYSSVGASTGGPGNTSGGGGKVASDVGLTVVDPIEEQILNVDQIESNTVEFQADLNGVYNLVFQNPYRLQALSVTVDYTINP